MTVVRFVPWIGVLLFLAALVMGIIAWKAYESSSVIVEWSTASELDTAGFNLYRRATADGPLIKVNENLIPASSDPLTGGAYQYTDRQVHPGQTYYYELEAVDASGSTTRYGSIQVKSEPGGKAESVLSLLLAIAGAFLLLSHRLKGKA